MTRWHWWAVVACVAAVCGCVCLAILDGRNLIKAQFGVAQRESQKTRDLIERQAADIRKEVLAEIRRQGDAIRVDAKSVVSTAVERTDRRVGETLARADRALATVENLRADLRPVLADADELLQQTSGTVAVLRPQTLGLIAATKRAAGETAQAARRVDAALPAALLTWDQIGQNVARASNESAETARQSRLFMSNLAAASKPLPAWARISLAVAPPIVQTGFTAASWMALKGKQ